MLGTMPASCPQFSSSSNFTNSSTDSVPLLRWYTWVFDPWHFPEPIWAYPSMSKVVVTLLTVLVILLTVAFLTWTVLSFTYYETPASTKGQSESAQSHRQATTTGRRNPQRGKPLNLIDYCTQKIALAHRFEIRVVCSAFETPCLVTWEDNNKRLITPTWVKMCWVKFSHCYSTSGCFA